MINNEYGFRTFGLTGLPVATNTLSSLADFKNGTLTSMFLPSTPTAVYIGEDGTIQDDVGGDGVDLSCSLALSNVILPGENNIVTSSCLADDEPSIEVSVVTGSSSVTVSFEVLAGLDLIDSVTYHVGVDNHNDMIMYEDLTGLSRSHTFDLSANNLVLTGSDTICGMVTIQTTDGGIVHYRSDLTASFPALLDVDLRYSHGGNMISFYYVHEDNLAPASVVLQAVWQNQPGVWEDVSSAAFGDIGQNITPGYKTLFVSYDSLKTAMPANTSYGMMLQVVLTDDTGVVVTALAGCLSPNWLPDVAITAASSGIRSGTYWPTEEDMSVSFEPVYDSFFVWRKHI